MPTTSQHTVTNRLHSFVIEWREDDFPSGLDPEQRATFHYVLDGQKMPHPIIDTVGGQITLQYISANPTDKWQLHQGQAIIDDARTDHCLPTKRQPNDDTLGQVQRTLALADDLMRLAYGFRDATVTGIAAPRLCYDKNPRTLNPQRYDTPLTEWAYLLQAVASTAAHVDRIAGTEHLDRIEAINTLQANACTVAPDIEQGLAKDGCPTPAEWVFKGLLGMCASLGDSIAQLRLTDHNGKPLSADTFIVAAKGGEDIMQLAIKHRARVKRQRAAAATPAAKPAVN